MATVEIPHVIILALMNMLGTNEIMFDMSDIQIAHNQQQMGSKVFMEPRSYPFAYKLMIKEAM